MKETVKISMNSANLFLFLISFVTKKRYTSNVLNCVIAVLDLLTLSQMVSLEPVLQYTLFSLVYIDLNENKTVKLNTC